MACPIQKQNFFKTINLPIYIFNRLYIPRVNQTWKRGSMLNKFIVDRDKRKTWHFEIMQNNIKSKNVFEKVHRPTKRQNVLNSLFIKNITDVLSTGDIAPELLGSNIEITGVKIAPCCRVLNVYWQIPPHNFESHEELATTLNMKAPRIRAELISRNLMGRVPQIFFLRDVTNAYLADFEKALKNVDLGPDDQSNIIPDDSFTKDIYSFKESKKTVEEPKEPKPTAIRSLNIPSRPPGMKTDVFGLRHDVLMDRVIAAKTKSKQNSASHIITAPEWKEDEMVDLFAKIPGGVSLHENQIESEREQLLKKFHLQRKMMRKEAKKKDLLYNDTGAADNMEDEPDYSENDYFEEDVTDRF